MDTIQVRAGQIIGRDHLARQANCQDSYALIERDAYLIGVVCDGCGEGQHSEVGATLAAPYLADQLACLLDKGEALERLPDLSGDKALNFLRSLLGVIRPSNNAAFIKDYFLFTLLGMVVTPTAGIIFAAGDGTIMINDQVMIRDQSNTPEYLAYRLLEPTRPSRVDVYQLDPTWQRAAIMSDGFETVLLPQIWGYDHPRGLQRKLNFWSGEQHRFRDDATIIAAERVAIYARSHR